MTTKPLTDLQDNAFKNTKKKNKEIQHFKCSLCDENITYLENGEIRHNTFFEIKRSNCSFEIDEEGDLNIDDENVKMGIYVCKKCFDKILNESKILGKYFLNKKLNQFVY